MKRFKNFSAIAVTVFSLTACQKESKILPVDESATAADLPAGSANRNIYCGSILF
jgi:hypothetical protein